MERIDRMNGRFFMPLDQFERYSYEGRECLIFDETTALDLIDVLKEGALGLQSQRFPISESPRNPSYNPEGRQLSKQRGDTSALEARITELEARVAQLELTVKRLDQENWSHRTIGEKA